MQGLGSAYRTGGVIFTNYNYCRGFDAGEDMALAHVANGPGAINIALGPGGPDHLPYLVDGFHIRLAERFREPAAKGAIDQGFDALRLGRFDAFIPQGRRRHDAGGVAKGQGDHPVRVFNGQLLGNKSPHGQADKMNLFDTQAIQQADHVVDEQLDGIGPFGSIGAAVAPGVIKRNTWKYSVSASIWSSHIG